MRETLRARLLGIMDRKHHWAWPHFAAGEIPLDRLRIHFQQEWETYVRDFPILLGRVLGHGPPDDVRIALAANLYEEQTGGISKSASHPELFLRMMEGCGYARSDFRSVTKLPEATVYRSYLDEVTWNAPWVVGCAVMTIFVEGSINDRRELAERVSRPPESDASIEQAIQQHTLVRVHHVHPAAMELVRVHKRIEGGHRHDAWNSILSHARDEEFDSIVSAVERANTLWLAYRDRVATACGLSRPRDRADPLASDAG